MDKYLETLEKLNFVVNVRRSSQRLYVIYDPTVLTKRNARIACDEAIKKQGLSPITINFYTAFYAPYWVWNITPLYKDAI